MFYREFKISQIGNWKFKNNNTDNMQKETAKIYGNSNGERTFGEFNTHSAYLSKKKQVETTG